MTSFTVLIETLRSAPMLFYFVVVIFSLMVGSFINVVIHRLPIMLHRRFKSECLGYLQERHPEILAQPIEQSDKKFNLLVPRSRCPHCQHQISAIENIPIISYLFLRGRCKQCHAPISIRYPIVEAVTALLALVVAYKFGVTLTTLFALSLTFALIALTYIDYDTQYLPDEITLPFLWLGLIVNMNNLFVDFHSAFIGVVAGYLVLWCVFQIFRLLTKKEGMGFGDFKLLALLGAWLGWQALPAIIIISSVIGSLVGISLIVFKRHDRNKPIPFGPYLAGAGWIVLLWGHEINHFYFHSILGLSS